ncbi:prepilin-type N-terminal cleavage/methylation domain-containing protein [Aliiglaciecola sp. 3_MG-2023]|uniref:prepilin-type N-terminal cleavage/methylation domain-containing protein n=1 Tax=Aliiglaciecola sp. 3_MG-2023 TaxID=3062644 RepID=UPI0026E1A5E7|nr:prepilin-type N-terminal cleavage/methylation domain-containing protein [Aliiglaciecola sp. 3_MG-2023]MDO6694041.1 prepilin-type N-terminal cleavage/methylation domain-containing protein [Aliiglaciecola sp. 3_MG-2023]
MHAIWATWRIPAMLSSGPKSFGFSLVELLIAMTIGLSAVASLAGFVGNSAAINSKYLMLMRLNEELNTVADLIAADLQRAGFNADISKAIEDPDIYLSQFYYPVVIDKHPKENSHSCILYAYDKDKNGVINVEGSSEDYGFRLHNNAVEMRQDGANCTAGGWQDLTDTSVTKVEDLQFTIIFSSQSSMAIRIHLSASVKKHSSISQQIVRDVFLQSQYDV